MTAPLLLTPGPLTTSDDVRAAMTVDWGSRDPVFVAMSDEVRATVATLAGPADQVVCVPVQGSGTFAVEATIGTLLPRDGRLLVLVNGAYGHRMVQIARTLGRSVTAYEWAEDAPVDPAQVDALLAADAAITHVAVVFCETTTGILNPLREIAAVVARHGRRLLIDAMSAFGALPLTLADVPFDAVMASSNKCLEGVPGIGFVIVRREVLAVCKGNSHSVALDLYDQATRFEKDGQWRFTPPTHVLAALHAAIVAHRAEGGVAGRGARYLESRDILMAGMRALGFQTLLPDALQAPIIITFLQPGSASYEFERFYDALRRRGFAIYPGKLTVADTFRVGCIGQVFPDDIRRFLVAVREAMNELGMTDGAAVTVE
jgi:2-aminoethylphosphonate-pyruvate transaminase